MAKKPLSIAHVGEEFIKTGNLVTDIKMYLNRKYKFRRNVISRNIELEGIPIDDKLINSIFVGCKTQIDKASKDLVTSIIFSDFVPDFNPFAEILNHYCIEKNYPKNPTGH